MLDFSQILPTVTLEIYCDCLKLTDPIISIQKDSHGTRILYQCTFRDVWKSHKLPSSHREHPQMPFWKDFPLPIISFICINGMANDREHFDMGRNGGISR